MRQTVVGVFETSDEARRAQAALLDAQFQPASIRVSAGGTPRGVDEGMSYPPTASFGGDFLTGPPAPSTPGVAAGMSPGLSRDMSSQAGADAGPLERVSEFFRDLFSPEDQQMEMARYEEAVRQGGTLVAVDVEDDLEETLASDILIRAGAFDLEERARSWGRPDRAAPDFTAQEDVAPGTLSIAAHSHASGPASRPATARTAAMPGNVTSMDPSDPTGYVASRSDTMGSGMPSGAVLRLDEEVDSLPPGPLDTRAFREGDGLPPTRRSPGEPLDTVGANRGGARGGADWTEADSLESDRLEVFPADTGPTEADRLESDLLEARAMGMHGERVNAAGAMHGQSRDKASVEAARNVGQMSDRLSPYLTEADRMESEQLEAARLEADRIEAERQEAARLDAAQRETRSAEAAHRVAEQRQAERLQALEAEQRSRMSASTGRAADLDDAVISSREAEHVLGSGEEMYLDDAGFASDREETMRAAAASQRQGRSPISRNVRIYSRRADDPAAMRAAAAEDDRMAPSTARNLLLREGDVARPSDTRRLAAGEDVERMRDFAARENGEGRRAESNFTPRSDTVTQRDAAVRGESLSPELMPDEWSAISATAPLTPSATPPIPPQRAARFEAADVAGVPPDSTVPPADPATDVRAELGLRSPLDDQRASRRRVLDDGAPFASDAYDDDDRRYATGTGNEYGTESGLVDARDPHPLQDSDGSEWDHIKRVVRDAWHRMTGHHH